MMWSLVIVICLANGDGAECREWKVQPFDRQIDCLRVRNETRAELEAAKPLHMALKCEAGVFG